MSLTDQRAAILAFNAGVIRARREYARMPNAFSVYAHAYRECRTCGAIHGNKSYATCAACRRAAKEES